MTTIVSHLCNFLFPTFCLTCQKLISNESLLCTICVNAFLNPSIQHFTIDKHLLTVYSLFFYEEPFSKIITAKFLRDKNLFIRAGRCLALAFEFDFWEDAILIPIPIHWTRRLQRGFNQTEILADEVASIRTSVKYFNNLIVRNKMTKFQNDLDPLEREKNVEDAFFLSMALKDVIVGQRIILIDDLCTTSATLRSIAKILLNFGAKTVSAITICKV